VKKVVLLLIILLLAFTPIIYFLNLLRPTGKNDKTEIVVISADRGDSAALELEEKGFIRSFSAFNIVFAIKGNPKIEPGGYYLSKNMSTWKIIDELADGPDLKEITIPEGIRKEQIGERLKKLLGWDDQALEKWNDVYAANDEYKEGVYFPDTYLIPVIETPQEIADRMIRNFNEKFAPFFDEAAAKNIKWTTIIKIASLIEREAAGPTDMPLISGVIWNRLNENQKLEIDATIQTLIQLTILINILVFRQRLLPIQDYRQLSRLLIPSKQIVFITFMTEADKYTAPKLMKSTWKILRNI